MMAWIIVTFLLLQASSQDGKITISENGHFAVAIRECRTLEARSKLDSSFVSPSFLKSESQVEFEEYQCRPMSLLLWIMTGKRLRGDVIQTMLESKNIRVGHSSTKQEVDEIMGDLRHSRETSANKVQGLGQEFMTMRMGDQQVFAYWTQFSDCVEIHSVSTNETGRQNSTVLDAWPSVLKRIVVAAMSRKVSIVGLGDSIGVYVQSDRFVSLFVLNADTLKTEAYACFLRDANIEMLVLDDVEGWQVSQASQESSVK